MRAPPACAGAGSTLLAARHPPLQASPAAGEWRGANGERAPGTQGPNGRRAWHRARGVWDRWATHTRGRARTCASPSDPGGSSGWKKPVGSCASSCATRCCTAATMAAAVGPPLSSCSRPAMARSAAESSNASGSVVSMSAAPSASSIGWLPLAAASASAAAAAMAAACSSSGGWSGSVRWGMGEGENVRLAGGESRGRVSGAVHQAAAASPAPPPPPALAPPGGCLREGRRGPGPVPGAPGWRPAGPLLPRPLCLLPRAQPPPRPAARGDDGAGDGGTAEALGASGVK